KWDTPFKAACSLGYLPSTTNFSGNEQDCLNSDGETDVTYALRIGDSDREARRTAINKAYPFVSGSGGISDESPVQMYILYMRTFQLACNPSSPKIESQLNAGDRNTHTMVKVVDGKGKSTDVYFTVPDLTTDKKIRVASVEGNS